MSRFETERRNGEGREKQKERERDRERKQFIFLLMGMAEGGTVSPDRTDSIPDRFNDEDRALLDLHSSPLFSTSPR